MRIDNDVEISGLVGIGAGMSVVVRVEDGKVGMGGWVRGEGVAMGGIREMGGEMV